MPKDLRSFIAETDSKHPEEIARVTKPISPRYEITALLTQLEGSKCFPLLICESVQGCEAPVVINVQASRKLINDSYSYHARSALLVTPTLTLSELPVSP